MPNENAYRAPVNRALGSDPPGKCLVLPTAGDLALVGEDIGVYQRRVCREEAPERVARHFQTELDQSTLSRKVHLLEAWPAGTQPEEGEASREQDRSVSGGGGGHQGGAPSASTGVLPAPPQICFQFGFAIFLQALKD